MVLLSAAVCVGAVGDPVKAGLTFGARLETPTPLSLAILPVVPLKVAMLSAMDVAGPTIKSLALIPLSFATFPLVPLKVAILSATADAGPAIRSLALTPLSLPALPVVPAKVTMLSVTEDAGPVKSPAPRPSAPLSPVAVKNSQHASALAIEPAPPTYASVIFR